ncbi:sugar phosphate isomerase/epimerase family protein [Maribacter ulvicola]|uniref:Sugar phosphate isomerase/epimerase n=1 Tax=Maribacter ulvicola TaxID=228959 RepID=A0A1N6VUG1_9FLAO|nr:sugar phosphate isomerase/epimerase [Maribacter ulvicola]SIQ81434.1 Sugar phosphate isomerase/epimerase [Maribacter ulvicola]
MALSRKNFIKTSGLGALALGTVSFKSDQNGRTTAKYVGHNLNIGLASYTLRKYSLDELLDITERLNLKDVALKSFHLPYDAGKKKLKFIHDKVTARGLNLYGGGVITMKTSEDVETYFNYANDAGLPMIIGTTAHHLLPLIEEKVKETNIKLAIHNHGPEDNVFPSPKSIYDKIKKLDSRIGLCIDVGHTYRLGLNPAEELIKYQDKLFDVHIKDIDAPIAKGNKTILGHGSIDIPEILNALRKIKYSGVVAIEYEKDENHAIYGLSESVGYIRGILKVT